MTHCLRNILSTCAIAIGSILPAHAHLIVTPPFYAPVANDPGSATVMTAIHPAILTYEDRFSNPITVDIFFQTGGGLASSELFVNVPNYAPMYDALLAADSNPAALATLTANGTVPATNMRSANALPGGTKPAPACHSSAGNCVNSLAAPDSVISLKTSLTLPVQPDSSSFSSMVMAQDEFDEILAQLLADQL